MIPTPTVLIRRIDKTLPLPRYETPGAVGLDLAARIDVTIRPGESARIPLNVVVKAPPGTMAGLFARSSLFARKGLILTNGVGVIDQDFCGDEDEIQASVFCPLQAGPRGGAQGGAGSDATAAGNGEPVVVRRGERICQLVLLQVVTGELTEVEHMPDPSRGGFGSTG